GWPASGRLVVIQADAPRVPAVGNDVVDNSLVSRLLRLVRKQPHRGVASALCRPECPPRRDGQRRRTIRESPRNGDAEHGAASLRPALLSFASIRRRSSGSVSPMISDIADQSASPSTRYSATSARATITRPCRGQYHVPSS